MNKKVILYILGVGLVLSSIVLFINLKSTDHNILEQTFVIKAIYFENDGYAEISFQDKSNKTKNVTLEVLGMPESFHKEFTSTIFIEKIQLPSAPKYGWHSIPVILLVEHEELGKIGIKTEIRPVGEIPATIIFSNY